MATTPNGLVYPTDYADPADSPAALEDLAISADSAISERALAARQVIAGAGLTGGGSLQSNRTFDVVAGNGIKVNADSVQVDYAAFDGRYARVYIQASQPSAGNIGDIWVPT